MNWEGEDPLVDVSYDCLNNIVTKYCWGADMPKQMLVTEKVGREIWARLNKCSRRGPYDPYAPEVELGEMRFMGISIIVLMGVEGRRVWFTQAIEPSQEYQGHRDEKEAARLIQEWKEMEDLKKRLGLAPGERLVGEGIEKAPTEEAS